MMKYFVFFLCLVSSIAMAQSKTPAVKNTADAEKKIATLRKEINKLSKAQQVVEEKRNSETKQLRKIDQQVAKSSQDLNKVATAVSEQQQKLEQLEIQQEQLEKNLRSQKEQLALLIRSAYQLGENSQLKHLLSQDKLADAARWLVYHQYFEKQRQAEITALTTELQELAAISLEIEQEKNVLAQKKIEQQQVVSELSKQLQDRKATVNTLDAKYKSQQAKIKALGKDEKALRVLLDKLKQAATKSKAPVVVGRPSNKKPASKVTPKNLTGWPLTGALIAGYGNAMPDGRASEGLLIAAPAGTSVYSVAAGRVIYADWLKGYGLLLVIDHGRGYMSLYANNDALFKEVGEAVAAGERVSSVGTSGAQNRAALYFEMRLNGQPQNPNSWLHP
ncbi:MAG TPA: peptidoglycan DD-metalloendopeptidase family protein [Arenimonas sp.]|nr:peptidoglycan DD-metalloendopeptidase family protein [Arenimonas sp.]